MKDSLIAQNKRKQIDVSELRWLSSYASDEVKWVQSPDGRWYREKLTAEMRAARKKFAKEMSSGSWRSDEE